MGCWGWVQSHIKFALLSLTFSFTGTGYHEKVSLKSDSESMWLRCWFGVPFPYYHRKIYYIPGLEVLNPNPQTITKTTGYYNSHPNTALLYIDVVEGGSGRSAGWN